MKNTIICIDPGHGGVQPGACYGGLKEKDAALSISLLVKAKLEQTGFRVVMTRETDVDIPLRKRCEISNTASADAFISIHLNAATSLDAYGAETWRWWSGGEFSRKLAACVQDGIIAETRARNRGVRQNASYCVLHRTNAPALVIECGFISNDVERALLFNPEYQAKIAKGIADGIEKAFK